MFRVTKKTVAPYSALAPLYDRVMAHVNYRRWAAYIHEIISRFRPDSKWIVDLACGTGTMCLLLEKKGYQVTGMDNSPEMLKQAVLKTEQIQKTFVCADLCSFPLSEKPDVVVSLYDSVNYLMQAERWRKSLLDAFTTLKEGGLFIFDVSTVQNSRQDFSRYIHRESFRDGSYLRKSTFNKKENIQTNYFEIKLAHTPKTIFCEIHSQRIRELGEILDFIERSPFDLIAGYKEFSFKPFDENCERVHFVLIKSG